MSAFFFSVEIRGHFGSVYCRIGRRYQPDGLLEQFPKTYIQLTWIALGSMSIVIKLCLTMFPVFLVQKLCPGGQEWQAS